MDALGDVRERSALATALGRLRTFALGISPDETLFSRRGFHAANPDARARLERVGETFVTGYHAALREGEPEGLAAHLDGVALELRGFAFEGAAMAFALLDMVAPWRRDRLQRFIAGDGAPHVYMAHVGAGWALARLRRPLGPALTRLDPLLGWLAADGYGFHEGYFGHLRSVERHAVPARLTGYARRAFDQGLGRSLWFVCGADGPSIAAAVGGFEPTRRPDLWSGVGLACAYAGGVPRAAVEDLRALAGGHAPHLAQGAAFAAKARERAGNPTDHTEAACAVLCGGGAAQAAAVTDRARAEMHAESGDEPAYEDWRRRVRIALSTEDRGS